MANAVTLIFWLGDFDVEIWGDVGNSFTKCLWNCDNILVRVEPFELN